MRPATRAPASRIAVNRQSPRSTSTTFTLRNSIRLVAPQLIAADLQELRGSRAVAGEEPVEDAGRLITRMPCIADKHAPQTSTEHERRAQPRRPTADDDGVKNFRVGKARRLGCDHNGNSKKLRNRAERESTRASPPRKQSRNRCTRGGWRRMRTLPLNRCCSRTRFSDGGRGAARWLHVRRGRRDNVIRYIVHL